MLLPEQHPQQAQSWLVSSLHNICSLLCPYSQARIILFPYILFTTWLINFHNFGTDTILMGYFQYWGGCFIRTWHSFSPTLCQYIVLIYWRHLVAYDFTRKNHNSFTRDAYPSTKLLCNYFLFIIKKDFILLAIVTQAYWYEYDYLKF